MLCYLIYVKNTKIHFITSYLPSPKSKLHHMRKFCPKYKLQYTDCFFRAKTALYIFPKPILGAHTAHGFSFHLRKLSPCTSYILPELCNVCLKKSCFTYCWTVSSVVSVQAFPKAKKYVVYGEFPMDSKLHFFPEENISAPIY